jgi:hypothetical protein
MNSQLVAPTWRIDTWQNAQPSMRRSHQFLVSIWIPLHVWKVSADHKTIPLNSTFLWMSNFEMGEQSLNAPSEDRGQTLLQRDLIRQPDFRVREGMMIVDLGVATFAMGTNGDRGTIRPRSLACGSVVGQCVATTTGNIAWKGIRQSR